MENDIGADGARAVSEMLKVNTSITSFELGVILKEYPLHFYRNISTHHCRCESARARVRVRVRKRNKIGVDGFRAMSGALKVNSTITSINLDCCCGRRS